MQCPRCDRAALVERDRDGVTIDVCPACRGVWLDRGELDKIIARTARAYHDLARDHGRAREDDDEPIESTRGHDDETRKRRKTNWLDSFGVLFD
jgi:uncharacterized protein